MCHSGTPSLTDVQEWHTGIYQRHYKSWELLVKDDCLFLYLNQIPMIVIFFGITCLKILSFDPKTHYSLSVLVERCIFLQIAFLSLYY